MRLLYTATIILCVATPVIADTYSPAFCEFSISPNITAERRTLRDQYGQAEVAEYHGKSGALKAQCARFLGEPWPKNYLVKYLIGVQKSSGVSYAGWSTHETPAGRAISLKGTKSIRGLLWKVWILGLSGKRSFFVITIGAPVKDFVPDFAWDAIQSIRRK